MVVCRLVLKTETWLPLCFYFFKSRRKWWLRDSFANNNTCTRCGRKVIRLAILYTNRQRCSFDLHMAVRLTPAVDTVYVLTFYSQSLHDCWERLKWSCVWDALQKWTGKFLKTLWHQIENKISSHLFLIFRQSGDRPQRICAARENCQSNLLLGIPWKAQEEGGRCATGHCTHLDAAPRQRPMSHGNLHQRMFGKKRHSSVSPAPLFAGSQSL